MTKKNLWLGILALTLVFTMTVVGCDDGSTDSKGNNNNSGSGSTGDIKVFAPSSAAITSLTIENSAGKIVKSDSSRISAKGWRSYTVAVGSYTIKAVIVGQNFRQTGYATVIAGGVTNVRF